MNEAQRRAWLRGDDYTPDDSAVRGLSADAALLRLHDIADRLAELRTKHRLSRADQAETDQLTREGEVLSEHYRRLTLKSEIAGIHRGQWQPFPDGSGGYKEVRSASGGRFALMDGAPGETLAPADHRDHRPADPLRGQRDTALRAIENRHRDGTLPAHGAEALERLLGTGAPAARSWAARWAVTTSSDEYVAAFAETLVDPTTAHLRWTPRQAEAFQQAEQLRQEMRAMSLTDSAGGYLVPAHLDPAILITNAGSQNPLRQIARVEQITGSEWRGVTSAGVSAVFAAEGDEAGDNSPTLGSPTVPAHKAHAFIAFSVELAGDAVGFMAEIGRLLADAADQLNANKYTVGTGTGEPTGLITALVAAGGSVIVPGEGTEALDAAADPYKVQNALNPRWQPNASWTAALPTLNALRAAETGNGAHAHPSMHAEPPRLLGRNAYELSAMDGTVNAAATEDNYLLCYGDFRQFLIVDRVGTTVEVVQHLVGSNRRPTGQRGAYMWYRTGSDVLVPDAFRLLNVPTTA